MAAKFDLNDDSVVVIVGVVLLVMLLLSRCSEDNCDATRNTFGADSLEYKQCVAQRRSGHRTGGGIVGRGPSTTICNRVGPIRRGADDSR